MHWGNMKYVVLEKYLSPPELRKAEERCECCFPMRMKSNSALKQILVSTSPELSNRESCSVTLKSFLDTLWQSWVNPSCHRQASMYVGGLISRFQWDSVSFQWGGVLQRFYIRSRGVAAAVSVFAKVKKSTNTETAMLSNLKRQIQKTVSLFFWRAKYFDPNCEN